MIKLLNLNCFADIFNYSASITAAVSPRAVFSAYCSQGDKTKGSFCCLCGIRNRLLI